MPVEYVKKQAADNLLYNLRRAFLTFAVFFGLVLMVGVNLAPVDKLASNIGTGTFVTIAALGLYFKQYTKELTHTILWAVAIINVVIQYKAGLPPIIVGIFLSAFPIILTRGKVRVMLTLACFAGIIVQWYVHLAIHPDPTHDIHVANAGMTDEVFDAFLIRATLVGIVWPAVLYYIAVKWEQSIQTSEARAYELDKLKKRQAEIYAIVGHELRTPASTIQMLLSNLDPRLKSGSIIDVINATDHLLRILDDMKATSAPGKEAEFPMHQIKVYHTIDTAVIGMMYHASTSGFRLDLTGKLKDDFDHMGNSKIILQIVQNLIKNAIKHSEGNHITVRLSYCSDPNNLDKTKYTIDVEDNGKGIPEDFRKKMWLAYERGPTKGDGTGLGLPIALNLAHALPEGNLTYTYLEPCGEEPGGSLFTLSFTLDKVKVSNNKETLDSKNLIKGKRILFVEDTDMLRILGVKILENNGAVVDKAVDGLSGLRRIEDGEVYDLILTDIMMPNMDGYDMTAAIRKLGYTGTIIGVTGATVGEEFNKLKSAGADDVISKPLTYEKLNNCLTRDHYKNLKGE